MRIKLVPDIHGNKWKYSLLQATHTSRADIAFNGRDVLSIGGDLFNFVMKVSKGR